VDPCYFPLTMVDRWIRTTQSVICTFDVDLRLHHLVWIAISFGGYMRFALFWFDLTWIAWLRDPFASYFVVLFLPAAVFILLYWSENSCLATFELCIGLISWEYRIPKLCVRFEFKLNLLYCCIGLKVCMKSWALQTFLFVFPNFYGGLSPWFRCFLQYWWACTNR